ncbi:hypothetical protein [Chryseobacterium binzhouense]|uniref:hypothetical protein n=1 Tax=Chryseobacterium binzhouense TaxID=2593646 RepID=UPI0028A0A1D1|nr:hypothetical protein [Chryseobacterium binzhouense]
MDTQERLAYLKKRNEELKPIVFVGFETKEELYKYRDTIKSERNEYYSNLKEIDKLEYELMSPEEREKLEEQRFISKLVREGKYFEYMIAKKEEEKRKQG